MDNLCNIRRRRSSLFSIMSVTELSSATSANSMYEKQLRREIKQWNELLADKYKEIQLLQVPPEMIDVSVLSEEQKRYIADGPTVESFMAETASFDKALRAYVERKTFLMERNAHIIQEAKALAELKLKDCIAQDLYANDFSRT